MEEDFKRPLIFGGAPVSQTGHEVFELLLKVFNASRRLRPEGGWKLTLEDVCEIRRVLKEERGYGYEPEVKVPLAVFEVIVADMRWG